MYKVGIGMVNPRGLFAGFVFIIMILGSVPGQFNDGSDKLHSNDGMTSSSVQDTFYPLDAPLAPVSPSFDAYFTEVIGEDGAGSGSFLLSGSDAVVRLQPGLVSILLLEGDVATKVEYELIGAEPIEPEGILPLAHKNYRITGGSDGVRTTESRGFREVIYKEVYPSTDLRYYLQGGRLKYDYVVRPGGDPGLIHHQYRGAEGLEVDPLTGGLSIRTGGSILTELAPVTYQDTPSERVFVPCTFEPIGDLGHGFMLGTYDCELPLVIDPELEFGTYLGGDQADGGWDIEVDEDGYVYAIGHTYSPDFPLTPGTYDSEYTRHDTWIAKLTPDGKSIVYATTVSSSSNDYSKRLDVDDQGCVYVAGHTWGDDFPYTVGSLDAIVPGNYSSFAFKLSADFSTLVYSARWGGASWDRTHAQTLAANGSLYVVGDAGRNDFPLPMEKVGGSPLNEKGSLYVLALNPEGTDITWGAYFGSSGHHAVGGVHVDDQGAVYVVGGTSDTFWTTPNAFDRVQERDPDTGQTISDGFILKFNSSGDEIDYSTLLGGSHRDGCSDLYVDEEGCAYVVGTTASEDFPSTEGAFDFSYSGERDVFVSKMGPKGEELLWSTFIGGSGRESDPLFGFDSSDHLYVVANSKSPDLLFTDGGVPDSPNMTAFVAKFDMSQGSLKSLLPLFDGLAYDGNEMAVSEAGEIHLVTMVRNGTLPTTPDSVQPEYAGYLEAHVCKFKPIEDSELDTDPPVADAGPNQTVDPDEPMTFNGTGSHDNNGIADFLWTFSYGNGITRLLGSTPEYTFDQPGECNVTLTVRDPWGNQDIDVVVITIRDNVPPVARPKGPIEAQVGLLVDLDGRSSTDDLGIIHYNWSYQADDQLVEFYGMDPEHVFMTLGDVEVTLRVTDHYGHWDEASITISVIDLITPDADAGPNQVVYPGDPVYLNGTGSTDNHMVVNWTWTVLHLDNNVTMLYGPEHVITLEEPGEYVVSLVATDPSGLTDRDSVLIVVRTVEEPNDNGGPDDTDPQPALTTWQVVALFSIIIVVLVIALLISISGARQERY
jgi:hypothetical protein